MRYSFITLAAVGCLIAGCESQPTGYVEPRYDLGHSVTLKGLNGVYVAEVDHQPVEDAQDQVPNYGWNTVLAEPGEHHLRVTLNHADGDHIDSRALGFAFRCEAGHVYEFTSNSPKDPLTLKVTDVGLRQSMVIDKSDEAESGDAVTAVASDDPDPMAADGR